VGNTSSVGSSISRREALRRGAALTASVAIAAPLVQSLGQVPAFAQVSDEPGDPPAVPSHIQLLVTFASDETKRGIKYDAGAGWGALAQQGNACWSPSTDNFAGATEEQVAYLNTPGNAPVTSTASGYEVTLPALVTVIEAAATFDGGNCFYLNQEGGPVWSGDTLIFPKPSSGQGNGA
jgi:hypothetical protein